MCSRILSELVLPLPVLNLAYYPCFVPMASGILAQLTKAAGAPAPSSAAHPVGTSTDAAIHTLAKLVLRHDQDIQAVAATVAIELVIYDLEIKKALQQIRQTYTDKKLSDGDGEPGTKKLKTEDEAPSLRASCHAALLVSLQPHMTPKTEEGRALFTRVMALSAADTSSGLVRFVPRHRTFLEDRPWIWHVFPSQVPSGVLIREFWVGVASCPVIKDINASPARDIFLARTPNPTGRGGLARGVQDLLPTSAADGKRKSKAKGKSK